MVDVDAICKDAVDTWGEFWQFNHTNQECGELIVAVTKYLIKPCKETALALVTEVVDVEHMCKQVRYILREYKDEFIKEDIKKWQYVIDKLIE
jgi:hypothetical protein